MEDLKTCIKEQKKLLSDFRVPITEDIITHMKSFKTEIAIENYVRSLIMHRLDAWQSN